MVVDGSYSYGIYLTFIYTTVLYINKRGYRQKKGKRRSCIYYSPEASPELLPYAMQKLLSRDAPNSTYTKDISVRWDHTLVLNEFVYFLEMELDFGRQLQMHTGIISFLCWLAPHSLH